MNRKLMQPTGAILSVVSLACLVGGMLFFGAIMAPLVFTKLPPDIAGPFIRATFPRYYWFIIASALAAATGFLLQRQYLPMFALLAIAFTTVWLLFWLIPHLNAFRLSNNTTAFARGHRLSVWINGAEFFTALFLLIRFHR